LQPRRQRLRLGLQWRLLRLLLQGLLRQRPVLQRLPLQSRLPPLRPHRPLLGRRVRWLRPLDPLRRQQCRVRRHSLIRLRPILPLLQNRRLRLQLRPKRPQLRGPLVCPLQFAPGLCRLVRRVSPLPRLFLVRLSGNVLRQLLQAELLPLVRREVVRDHPRGPLCKEATRNRGLELLRIFALPQAHPRERLVLVARHVQGVRRDPVGDRPRAFHSVRVVRGQAKALAGLVPEDRAQVEGRLAMLEFQRLSRESRCMRGSLPQRSAGVR